MKVAKMAIVEVSVCHGEPVLMSEGLYSIRFWLALKVDIGDAVGVGNSQPVSVTIKKDSIGEARAAAMVIDMAATSRIKNLEASRVLATFPALLAELSSQEEPKED